MIEEKSIKRIVCEAILGIAVLVWSFLVLNQGFYMDESGMISIYRGIYLGNRMLVDAWGAHQMGWFMAAPFFFLYDLLKTSIYPMGIGIILFMRICYQLVRLCVSIYLYATVRKTEYKNGAFLAALTYYVFLDNFKNLSYKSMCDMAIMLFLCWAFRYFQTKNKWFFLLMGIATCTSILAYPSMILFPVFFVIGQIIMIRRGYELTKPLLIYCFTCFTLGLLVVLYIQFTSGIANVLPQLQYTEDAAYKHPIYIRIGIMLLSYIFFAVVAYAPVILMKIISKFRYVSKKTVGLVLSVYWIVFMTAVIGLRPGSASTTRFIYGCLVVLFWYPYFIRKTEKEESTIIGKYGLPGYDVSQMALFALFISAVVQLIWAMTTNQEVTVPGHMSIYIVIGTLLLAEKDEYGLKILRAAIVVLAIFFMGIWVPEADGGYNDIFEHRTIVADGGYRGIALDDFDYQMNQSCQRLIYEYVKDDDYLYIVNAFGTTGYFDTDAIQAAGSPWSRVGAGQLRVLQYWEVNPDRQPDYILIDTANKYYENYTQGETMAYINEHYPTVVATDGNVVLLSK